MSSPVTLCSIPAEILNHIDDFMPPSSACCLSITSKYLRERIKIQNLHFDHPNIENSEGEIHVLLSLLSRDIPDQIPCFYCCKMHDAKISPELFTVDSPEAKRNCVRADIELGIWSAFAPGIGFTHLQFAMKLHSLGRDNSLYLDAQRDSRRTHSYRTSSITYTTQEVRIDPDQQEMIMRRQCWIVTPRSFLQDNDAFYKAISLVKTSFCSHQSLWDGEMVARSFHRRTYPPGVLVSFAPYPRFEKCNLCEMELHFALIDYQHKGVAIVVTGWQNLGKAPSPRDPNWCTALNPMPHGSVKILLRSTGEIVKQFEGGEETASFVPSLTEAQEAELWKRV